MKAGHWIIMAGLATVLVGGILWMLPEEVAPRRKSGLWEMTNLLSTGSAPTTAQICIDQASDDLLTGADKLRQGECSKFEWRREDDHIVVHSVCKIEGSQATAHGILTGDFETAYHTETFISFDPPLRGNEQVNTSQDARWLGPCPDDLKPGDVVLPDGSIRRLENANAEAAAEEPAQASSSEEAAPPEP